MKVLKNKDVHHASCPQVEGAYIDNLLKFLRDQKMQDYLPPKTRKGKELTMDRSWLLSVNLRILSINVSLKVCMTLGKDDFIKFRGDVLEKRRKRLLESSNANVTTASEIAAVLEKS